MKRLFFIFIFLLFFSANVFAEYRLEPVNCTIKKKDNCGAYLYNSNTGATYFCDSVKCTEIMPALEEASEAAEEKVKGKKKSKIPKKPKIKKKKSKIPKFKKKSE